MMHGILVATLIFGGLTPTAAPAPSGTSPARGLLALASVPAPCPHGHGTCRGHTAPGTESPTPALVCHMPPSADLPPGLRLVMPEPAPPAAQPARGTVTFNVAFDDGGLFAPWHAQLTSHVQAAGQRWAQVLGGSVSIEVVIRPFSGPRAAARSVTSRYVGTIGGIDIWMAGAAAELRHGVDPNGSGYDIEIFFGADLSYLAGELWFDPDPVGRTAPVPANRTDAVSVILHELGHAWGFNGWRDWNTGQLPGSYMSTFDRWVQVTPLFWFVGPAGVNVWNGDIALTNGNIFHLGNAGGPGSALVPYLMNGVVFYRGTRYDISQLELAMLADTNALIAPPANNTCAAAQPIGPGTIAATSFFASGTDITPCGASDSADVWFSYTAAGPGLAEVTTCGPGVLDTTLAVYGSCGGMPLGCDDNACGVRSRVSWPVQGGQTYRIRVAGVGGATGAFSLTLSQSGCPADWNGDTLVNSGDISAFLTDWLASVQQGTLVADFNGDQVVNSSDISAFLTAWLEAVQNGC